MSSYKTKINSEQIPCEKYLNRVIRQERSQTRKQQQQQQPTFQEKLSTLSKSPPTNQRPKSRPNVHQKSSVQPSVTSASFHDPIPVDTVKAPKPRQRSASSSASHREPWGQLLLANRSRERVSSFSSFDPLRTLHFLSKELHFRLQSALPEQDDIHQMVADIQHALKRIPPEVASMIHIQQEFLPTKPTTKSTRSLQDDLQPVKDKLVKLIKTSVATKSCQTPPTLYQDDTEIFQRIMEENALKLEASCKQLEVVCTNLQNEKDLTDKELEEAREHVEMLCKRVKELESQIEQLTNIKIKQLEAEKDNLQKELNKVTYDNPNLNHLKKLVDDLRIEKVSSDQTRARLEYDMTLLSMEKEKFVTLLAVRDQEIKEIQEEMSKIQEQVRIELNRLNGEVLTRATSLKNITTKSSENLYDNRENFVGLGDTTISSITTNDSTDNPVNLKETPCGDAENSVILQEKQDNLTEKLAHMKANSNADTELLAMMKDEDAMFNELLREVLPSCKSLKSSQKQ